jgi:hypothetical protein
MKRFIVLALAIVLAPVTASADDLRSSITDFCAAIVDANQMGISAAPGTVFAERIIRRAKSDYSYVELWHLAKGMGIPSCRAMW